MVMTRARAAKRGMVFLNFQFGETRIFLDLVECRAGDKHTKHAEHKLTISMPKMPD